MFSDSNFKLGRCSDDPKITKVEGMDDRVLLIEDVIDLKGLYYCHVCRESQHRQS